MLNSRWRCIQLFHYKCHLSLLASFILSRMVASQASRRSSVSSSSPRQSIHQDVEKQEPRDSAPKDLEKITSNGTTTHEVPPIDIFAEAGDEIYKRFTPRRKQIIVFVLSFSSFLSPVSSTAVLSAIPEVAGTFNTSSSVINITNALYLVAMGLSPMFFGPISTMFGRRWVSLLESEEDILLTFP